METFESLKMLVVNEGLTCTKVLGNVLELALK